ncbi:copper amine oxidase N-terminal domain-containing protein, partial [bacterium]|nr:copper amine oxidase N-terminal domain-containing protein [bacterium]
MNIFTKCASVLALVCAVALPSMASLPEDFISVKVNGKILYLDQAPVLQSGTTLVPMRAIFEALGAKIKWDAATKTVIATTTPEADSPNVRISLTINAPTATVNGQELPLLAPAQIISGNTMVPLRFVGEGMGAKVKWYGNERLIAVAQDAYSSTLDNPEFIAPNWDTNNLARIQVGGQAGLLKVLNEDRSGAAYTRTLDNYTKAAYTDEQRAEIRKALGIEDNELDSLAIHLINNYHSNRKHANQLLALVVALAGNERPYCLDPLVKERVMAFLVNKLENADPKLDKNSRNVLKRQALLSLALMNHISPEALEAVIKFYAQETNNY